jgi:hypothetical protein
MNDFSMLDEIEKYLLEIFGDKTNALKLNKDFMKSFKKSDQLEGEEKIFFQIKYF